MALLGGCGNVTSDPHDAAGSVGGAGGQLAAAGTSGGSAAAGAPGGAAGSAPGGQGGAGGAAWPPCPTFTAVAVTNGSAHCLEGCSGVDAGAAQLCEVPTAEAAKFTNAPGPIYCWQGNAVLPAACY